MHRSSGVLTELVAAYASASAPVTVCGERDNVPSTAKDVILFIHHPLQASVQSIDLVVDAWVAHEADPILHTY